MLITDICIARELQETIFNDDPLLRHSLYIVEYDNYMLDQIPWHWHNELELIYIASGACIYRTSRREYHLQTGDAVYLNPGMLHALEPTMDNMVSYANLFDRIFLTGTDGSYFDLHYAAPVFRQKSVEAVPIYHGEEGTEHVNSEGIPGCPEIVNMVLESVEVHDGGLLHFHFLDGTVLEIETEE